MRVNLQARIDEKFGGPAEFAERAGVHPVRLGRIINGFANPTWQERGRFSELLSFPSWWIFRLYVVSNPPLDDGSVEPGGTVDQLWCVEDVGIVETPVLAFGDVVDLASRALDAFQENTTKKPSAAAELNQPISLTMRYADFAQVIVALANQTMRAVECAIRIARADRRLSTDGIFERVLASQSNVGTFRDPVN